MRAGAAIALGALLLVAAGCGGATTKTGAAAKSSSRSAPTWQQVRAKLHEDGIGGERDVAHTSSDADSIGSPDGADPNWYVWVFKDGTASADEVISGSGWKMDLSGKQQGRVYWTKFVKQLPDDPTDKAGSWYGVTLYGKNLALVVDIFRYAHRDGVPPPNADQMPGTYNALDEALGALTAA